MRLPPVVAAWIRHVRACAPAGHVTVDIGLLKNAKFQGDFKKWMPFSHLSQILYELEKKSSLVTRGSLCKILRSCDTEQSSFLHSATASCKRWPVCITRARFCREKHSYPNLIPIVQYQWSRYMYVLRPWRTISSQDAWSWATCVLMDAWFYVGTHVFR